MSTTSSLQTSLVSGLLIHDVNVISIYCALQNLLTVILERFLKPLIGYDIRPCTETWMYWYHSVLQGISPTLKYWSHHFLPRLPLPPPKKNYKSARPLPLWATPLKILENLTLPPLKCTFVQKNRDSFFKEAKDFILNNEIRTHFNVEKWIYSCKI